MTRAALLAAAVAVLTTTTACRQIVGIQPLPKPCGDPLMIDDMEDGDASICNTQGRHGVWFSRADGSGSDEALTPSAAIPGGRASSRRAVHFTGSGYTTWGALAGFNFDDDGTTQQVYAAGTSGGLTFWMKSTTAVTVQVLLPETVLPQEGQCVPTASPNNCNDHFAFRIAAPGPDWTQYQVPFTALQQSATGSATWDPSQLLGVQFQVDPGPTFDLWIDDVAFYDCPSTACVPTCTSSTFPSACPKTARHAAGCFIAGASCSDVDNWCRDPMLIDDMEDGDDNICATGGRHGTWYLVHDAAGSGNSAKFHLGQIPGDRGHSHRAAEISGQGVTERGPTMGVSIASANRATYDARTADGVRFWVRGTGLVRVQVKIPATTPSTDAAGTCTNGWDCDNHFYFPLQAGNEWVDYHVPFAALRQGPGGTATWDPSQLIAIELSVFATSFLDVWIDDVGFFNCTADACIPTCSDPAYPVACPTSTSYPASCWPTGTDCAAPPDLFAGAAVWSSGPADGWLVGSSPASGKGRMLGWNGAAWTSVAGAGDPPILGLWGSAPNDVWAVGVRGTIEHWSGSEWTTIAGGTASNLQAVSGSGPGDVWATGSGGTIVHWDGTSWSSVKSGTTEPLSGVWIGGPAYGWAVGDAGTIVRLTSAGWAASTSGTSVELAGVWGSSATDAWAVGVKGTILRWNGSTWAGAASNTSEALASVWGSSPTDVWTVGTSGTILRWDGSAWTAVASNTPQNLTSVSGSAADDVWAVGENDTVLHFDGSAWTPVTAVWSAP